MKVRDFLRTLVMRRLDTFIVVEGRPRSRERKVSPSMGDAEFNAPRSRALLLFLDRRWHGIGSLDVADKLYPYKDL